MKSLTSIKEFILRHWVILTGITFVIFITLFRIIISHSGHLFWEDELRYVNAFISIDTLAQGDIKSSIGALFNAHARPGYIIISLIPAGIQLLAIKHNLINLWNEKFFEYLQQSQIPVKFNPAIFDIPSFFNVLAITGCMFFVYKILNIFIKDRKWALLGTIVFSLLTNTNLYIRQMVPYSYSLLFFLWAAYWVLNAEEKRGGLKKWPAFLVGIISAFAFSIYPAYYLFVAIIGFMILYLSRNLLLTFIHGCGVIVFTAGLEMLSRFGGYSYLDSCRQLSTSATQGDFGEGFIFPFHYLYEIEGGVGIVIAILFVLFTFLILPRSSKLVKSFFIIFLLGYLYHATMSVFFKKVVFYGRILHMYYPFIIIGAVLAIKSIPSTFFKRAVIALLLITSVISFKDFTQQFVGLDYPLDLQQKNIRAIPQELIYYTHDYKSVDPNKLSFAVAVVINALSLHPIYDFHNPFNPTQSFKLVVRVKHPIMFKAYQYEGHSAQDRINLNKRPLTMSIYVREMFMHKNKSLF